MTISLNFVPPPERVIQYGPIERAVKKGTVPELMRFGAFTRRRAQTSLRYRTKKSAPGQPPSAHRSKRFTRLKKSKKHGTSRQPASPLRELMSFAVIESGGRTKVIIGPKIFTRSKAGLGLVPRRSEQGGSGTFVTDDGETKVGIWPPRPYMGPAFRAELGTVPGIFAGSVRA